ncbi:hypothetical protein PspCFBP13508_03495 [Pseudomonas sp. CFBP13508]|nr:hypothetical protein PspCFBP13508_03495 [Pseudomonas sp. CFBP13508]
MGASLLAKAYCQSTYLSSDTPLSRAGSLPHEICGVVGNLSTTENPVGVSLLTNAAGQVNICI